VATERLHLIAETHLTGAPDLVVEVLKVSEKPSPRVFPDGRRRSASREVGLHPPTALQIQRKRSISADAAHIQGNRSGSVDGAPDPGKSVHICGCSPDPEKSVHICGCGPYPGKLVHICGCSPFPGKSVHICGCSPYPEKSVCICRRHSISREGEAHRMGRAEAGWRPYLRGFGMWGMRFPEPFRSRPGRGGQRGGGARWGISVEARVIPRDLSQANPSQARAE
jgi:hypothetical protein